MRPEQILSRLIQLDAALDGILQFYVPNTAALGAVKGIRADKGAWKSAFRQARLVNKKPMETLLPRSQDTAAVKASNGKVYRGPMHAVAALKLQSDRPGDFNWLTKTVRRAEKRSGFVTTQQPFVTTGEATQIAKRKHRWEPGQEPWRNRARPGLHSSDLED